jgi:hypothetical protein
VMNFKCYYEQGSYPYIKMRAIKGFAVDFWMILHVVD